MARADAEEAILKTARTLARAVRRAEEHGGEHQVDVAHHLERLVAAVEAQKDAPEAED